MNASPGNRTILQYRPLQRKVSLLMFLVMILGSLASIAPYLSTPAAAQPLCLDGQVWSEEEQACVEMAEEEPVLEEPTPTETPQPTETPAEVVETPLDEQSLDNGSNDDQTATGSPAAELPGDDLSSLQAAAPAYVNIGSYACPEDFDAYSSSIDVNIIQRACAQLNPGVEFTVVVDGQAYAGQGVPIATTGGTDTIFSYTVPAGSISISQTPLERFGQPVVACYVGLAQGGTAREYGFYPVVQGNVIEISGVEAGQSIRCNWYSVPTDASAVVIVKKFACPPGFDTSIAGPDQLKQNCPAYKTPVEFQLIHDTGGGIALQLVKLQTTALSPAVVFRSVKAGDFRIKEAVPTGFGVPIVYCEQFGPNGQTIRQYDRYIMFSVDSIAAITNTLETLSCDWFNVPGQLPVVPADAQLSEGVPPDIGTPMAQLPDQIDQAEEAEIPDDTADTGTPVAQLPDQFDQAEEAEIPDDTVGTVTIVPPMAERADEIEIPDNSPGRVTIEAYACPESFDAYNATPNEINTRCPYAGYIEGQIFEYSLIDGAGALQIQHTGLKQPFLEFDVVAPGVISITAAAPAGFGEPVVYCQEVAADSDGPYPYERQTLASPNSIEHTLSPSEWLACGWFNVPTASPFNDVQGDVFDERLPLETVAEEGEAETGTDDNQTNTGTRGDDQADVGDSNLQAADQEAPVGITISSYVCMEDFDAYNNSLVGLQSSCTQLRPGAAFTASTAADYSVGNVGSYPVTKVAGNDSIVRFSVRAGDISIYVFLPEYEYFAEPVVACEVFLAPGGPARDYRFYPVVQGNAIEIDAVEPGQRIRCDWWSVPRNDSAVVTIEKYACPPGFDTSIAGPDQLKQNCPYAKTPVEFQLLHETGGLTLGHTEVDYPKVGFYNFEAGDFTIKESIPAGFGVPIVYCEQFYHGRTIRQYDRYIMISVDTIAALINTREILRCDWFNVPGSLPVAGIPPLQSESIPLDIASLQTAASVPSEWFNVPGELPIDTVADNQNAGASGASTIILSKHVRPTGVFILSQQTIAPIGTGLMPVRLEQRGRSCVAQLRSNCL